MPDSSRLSGFTVLLVAGALACQQTTPHEVVPPPPPAPPAAPSFHIEPQGRYLSLAETVQFSAVASSGATVLVRWRMADTFAGRITSDGLFTADSCAGGAPAAIIAELLADTTQTAAVVMQTQRMGPMGIQLLWGMPAPHSGPDTLAGTVTYRAEASFSLRTCVSLAGLRLEAHAGSVVIPADSLMVAPNTRAPEFPSFTWNTTMVPNGAYELRAAALIGNNRWDLRSNAIPVFVKNP